MTDSNQPGELRYHGPDDHADWCPGDPSHQGACLDEMLAKVNERAEQSDERA